MKYIVVSLILTGCVVGTEAEDYQVYESKQASPAIVKIEQASNKPNASPHQAPDNRYQCVPKGVYSVQFVIGEQAVENGSCDGIAVPEVASIEITDEMDFLGCKMQLDNEACIFNAINQPCQVALDGVEYSWNGRIAFENIDEYVPVEVSGMQLYEVFRGFYGMGSIRVSGLCSFDVFLKIQTDI